MLDNVILFLVFCTGVFCIGVCVAWQLFYNEEGKAWNSAWNSAMLALCLFCLCNSNIFK